MKSILSLIALAYLIQFSFSSSDIPTVTVLEDGILPPTCLLDQINSLFKFSIPVQTEGFTAPHEFKMLLETPGYIFATCTVGYKETEVRSTTEEEYMDCEIDTSMFPIYGTSVTLSKNYGGDGTFELNGWDTVIGKKNVVITYVGDDGCYQDYRITFTPNGDFFDQCTDQPGEHIFSVTGTGAGEFMGELNFVAWFLVAGEKYRGGVCRLAPPSETEANTSDLELTCKVEAFQTLQFFDTLPYDQVAGQYVRIYPSEKFGLKDCFSTFTKLSALLLLSLLF